MTQTKKIAWALAAAALVCVASAQGQEKRVKKSDLPAAVQKAADEQSKGATVRGTPRKPKTENSNTKWR